MGFKARARKARAAAGETKQRRRRAKEVGEGEKPCDVKDCDNWADKGHGGRSIAFDNAADVFGDDAFDGESRRVHVCKKCYREYKKAQKDDKDFQW